MQANRFPHLTPHQHNRSAHRETASSLNHPVTECQQTRRSSVDCWQHRRPPAQPPAVSPPRRRLLAGPARQHGLLAVPAGRRGQLAITQSSGSLPACAAWRGRMLAYYYKYTGTASMQTHSVNTASRMPESALGWSILQDEPRRVTPETAICEGLAMMLRLAPNLVDRVGGQGLPAVVEPIWVVAPGARAPSWSH